MSQNMLKARRVFREVLLCTPYDFLLFSICLLLASMKDKILEQRNF